MSNSSLYNRNNFPDYIYYGASEKVAAQYESTYSSIASRSNLSLENRYLLDNLGGRHDQTHSVQHDIMQKLAISNKEVQADFNRKFAEIMDFLQAEKNAAALAVSEGAMPVSNTVPRTENVDPQSQGSGSGSPPPSSCSSRPQSTCGLPQGSGGPPQTQSKSEEFSAETPHYPPVQARKDVTDFGAHWHGEDEEFFPFTAQPTIATPVIQSQSPTEMIASAAARASVHFGLK